jgi:hypothetical protein
MMDLFINKIEIFKIIIILSIEIKPKENIDGN